MNTAATASILESSSSIVGGATFRNIAHDALSANKKLQQALSERAAKLEAELKEVDRLLASATAEEGEDDPESEVSIPGAKKPYGLFSSSEFLTTASPFYEEAVKRSNFVSETNPHPMKAKDMELLADAVKRENERLEAYRRSQNPALDRPIDLLNNINGLDWSRIAERVSDSSSVKRNATECRITWVADRHPLVNHTDWPASEVGSLNMLLVEYQQTKSPVNWTEVAEKLGTNRTPIDCMRHGLPRHRFTWSSEADQRLTKAVESCGIDNWQLVARKVSEHTTPTQCQTRWTKSVDPALKRGSWTEEEDNRLRKAVSGYGTSWIQVASAIPGRTNDQCRERWLEHVNVDTSQTAWTEDEDKLLIASVEDIGNQWKVISSKIGNKKTGQACRQRFDKLKRAQRNQAHAITGSSILLAVPPAPSMDSFQATSTSNLAPTSSSSAATENVPNPRPKPKARAKGKAKAVIDSSISAQTMVALSPELTALQETISITEAQPPPPQKSRRKQHAILVSEMSAGMLLSAEPAPKPRPKPKPSVLAKANTTTATSQNTDDQLASDASLSTSGRKQKVAEEQPDDPEPPVLKRTRAPRTRRQDLQPLGDMFMPPSTPPAGNEAAQISTSAGPSSSNVGNAVMEQHQIAGEAPQPRRSGRLRRPVTLS